MDLPGLSGLSENTYLWQKMLMRGVRPKQNSKVAAEPKQLAERCLISTELRELQSQVIIHGGFVDIRETTCNLHIAISSSVDLKILMRVA